MLVKKLTYYEKIFNKKITPANASVVNIGTINENMRQIAVIIHNL